MIIEKGDFMKNFLCCIVLLSSYVFATNYEIIVKIPVQLEKLPSEVKIDGEKVRYNIQCVAKNTEHDGLYAVNSHTFNNSYTSDINEIITLKLRVANEETLTLANKIICNLGLKKISSMYATESVESHKIKNLPEIDIKQDQVVKIIE
jgi:hypothetical protein